MYPKTDEANTYFIFFNIFILYEFIDFLLIFIFFNKLPICYRQGKIELFLQFSYGFITIIFHICTH